MACDGTFGENGGSVCPIPDNMELSCCRKGRGDEEDTGKEERSIPAKRGCPSDRGTRHGIQEGIKDPGIYKDRYFVSRLIQFNYPKKRKIPGIW
jgi:hypothetical protein